MLYFHGQILLTPDEDHKIRGLVCQPNL
jgi:hypothetical protein